MDEIKTVLVTGATGNQGGAVARNLAENNFKVKALTRDPGSSKAQKLQHPNIEYVRGDLNDIGSYAGYLQGLDAVFSVQSLEHTDNAEIKQGLGLASMANESGIRHFIYSSTTGADLQTGIPHWESKWVIENHIKQIGLPYTILRPASLYENFLIPQVKSRILKGKLVTPVKKNKIQQFVGAEEIGKMNVRILKDPIKYMNITITIATEEMNNEQVVGIFSEVMGVPIKYQQLPSIIVRLAMGKNLYKMFSWINENNAVFIKDLQAFRNEYPSMESLKQWIVRNFKTT
jgi:Predicted nucleoside-diphosphate-sugar epimerases